MEPQQFRSQLASLATQIAQQLDGQPPHTGLADWLDQQFGPQTATFQDIVASCLAGVRDGWLCNREAGGIRYGRIFKPAEDLQGFSVDVVDMDRIAGPRHLHPQGEIDMVMPLSADAQFDGKGAGWVVYGPGSVHAPTVSHGRALVLYLLPNGAIEFHK